MTTGWGTRRWAAPRTAYEAAGRAAAGEAAPRGIPAAQQPDVIIALGAQVRSVLRTAALLGPVTEPDPAAWEQQVPCAPVRQLAAMALAGRTVRVPAALCGPCTAAALGLMAAALVSAMTAAGTPADQVPGMLAWLASAAL